MSKPVLIETSARHVHVSKEDLETLFGKGYELTPKAIFLPARPVCLRKRVTVVGPKRELKGVSFWANTSRDSGLDFPYRRTFNWR